jgi:hypothetical protein
MEQKEFFSELKGKGPMINTQSDYEDYLCRVGLKTGQAIHSETVRKNRFRGEGAKKRAEAWIEQQREELEKEPEKAAEKSTRKGRKP